MLRCLRFAYRTGRAAILIQIAMIVNFKLFHNSSGYAKTSHCEDVRTLQFLLNKSTTTVHTSNRGRCCFLQRTDSMCDAE